jgi:hypothetical protein
LHAARRALRDLLCALARAPLVLFIDDVQWGGRSAAILQQVLRQPDGPTLLLNAACRSEDASGAVLVKSMRDASPAHIRDIGVDRLSHREARDLAAQLIAGSDGGPGHADAIARHAAGSPLFVHQIAQHAIALGSPMRFDVLVRERVDALRNRAGVDDGQSRSAPSRSRPRSRKRQPGSADCGSRSAASRVAARQNRRERRPATSKAITTESGKRRH